LDAGGTRENLLRIIALKERLPEPIIAPAHDMPGKCRAVGPNAIEPSIYRGLIPAA
jgi:hypothetical protein